MITAATFTAFCVVCVVLAFVRHPIWGLYFYLATTYVFPQGRWWGQVFGEFRWALFAAGVTALAVIFHRGKLAAKPSCISYAPVLLLVLYAAWMWVQRFWALDPVEHTRGTIEFTKCLIALWFVYRVVDSKERLTDLLFAHVMGCGLLGVLCILTGRAGERLDGVGGPNMNDANTLGMYLATGAIAGIGVVLARTGWRRYATLATLPCILFGFVLANSRGAFLGLVAGALVLVFVVARRHRRRLWLAGLAGLLCLVVLVDQVFIDRMFTIQDVTSEDEEADASARSRMVIAEAQLQMFSGHPMGIGWRGTEVLSTRYMDTRWLTKGEDGARSSHNTYLTALVEQGLPGAVLYYCLVLWVLGAAVRLRRMRHPDEDPELITLGAALCGALVVVLTAGVAADYLTKEVQFWLYAGLVSVFCLSRRAAGPVLRPGPESVAVRRAT